MLMGYFIYLIPLDHIEPFFATAGLPWEPGTGIETTVAVNEGAVGPALAARLPRRYSLLAGFLKGVAPYDVWYRTDEHSVNESSRVSPPARVYLEGETPVALTRIGNGKLGYIGDIDWEDASSYVVCAMCGLL